MKTKTHWETKKFSEICTLIKGRKPALHGVSRNGCKPYLVAKFLRGSEPAEYASPDDRNSISVGKNEIIIICDGSNSGETFIGFEGILSSTMAKISHNDCLHTGFLLYLLETTFEDFNKSKTGAAIPHLDLNKLRELPIKHPPLPEQRRIAQKLDEAFAAITRARAAAEQNLQNARALFEGQIQLLLSKPEADWRETTLDDCCDQIFAGGDVPKGRVSDRRTETYPIPIFSNGAKDEGLYGYTDTARVSQPALTVSARGTIGFSAIRNEPFLPVVRLIVLVPNIKRIDLAFLYYAVNRMDFGNTGTSIPQLTVPNFKNYQLSLPPLEVQQRIVTQLDALSAETRQLASLYQRKLDALAELKKSLLHQAFSGGL